MTAPISAGLKALAAPVCVAEADAEVLPVREAEFEAELLRAELREMKDEETVKVLWCGVRW
jgi:hypothetical protein